MIGSNPSYLLKSFLLIHQIRFLTNFCLFFFQGFELEGANFPKHIHLRTFWSSWIQLGEAQTPRSLRMSQQKTSKISFDKTFFSLLNLSLSLLGGVAPILAIFDQNFDRFGQFWLATSCSKKIKTKLFKLRKVNHTLGDHRSGRAWDSNHGPNETDGRHL